MYVCMCDRTGEGLTVDTEGAHDDLTQGDTTTFSTAVCMYVCMYVGMYVFMYVCI